MPELRVTALTAAILAVGIVGLALAVSFRRRKVGVTIGLGEDQTLHRLVRAHGNLVEYAPIGLILIGLTEYAHGARPMLWIMAGLLLAGRALHAGGMLAGSTPVRAIGMLLTHAALLAGAVAALQVALG